MKRLAKTVATVLTAAVTCVPLAQTAVAAPVNSKVSNVANASFVQEASWEMTKKRGQLVVTLKNATVLFDKSSKTVVVHDMITMRNIILPNQIKVGTFDAGVMYTPISEHSFGVHYLTDRFDLGCYGKVVVASTVGGTAGGAAWGFVSGLPFVPVEPVTVSAGATGGFVTGLVGGIAGGIFTCW